MISFRIYLEEGMIKLPEKMFKKAEEKIVSELCSFVITDLQKLKHDPEVHKFIELVKKIASKHAAPIRFLKKKTVTKFKVELSFKGLPEKYQAGFSEEHVPDLEIELDWTASERLAARKAVATYSDKNGGHIVVGLASITQSSFLRKAEIDHHNAEKAKQEKRQYKSHLYNDMVEMFEPHLKKILISFEHELTHYVQYKALSNLHPEQVSKTPKADMRATGKEKNDLYYNSQVEFDPLIRSALGAYHKQEKDNLDSKLKGTRRGWIDVFVGAKAVPKQHSDLIDEKNGGFIIPSKFFLSLKKYSPDKWKKAIKLFTQELEKRYPQ